VDAYYTIQEIEEVLYKDKASKFIGYAYGVSDEQEIKQKLERIRMLHPKATHCCYAYRLGLDKFNFRANDDGEPAGTAGNPILGQIDAAGLTFTLIAVVRYFGGTKLGVSGLIDAYRETAKLTLASSSVLEKKILDYYRITCPYAQINVVYRYIQLYQLHIVEQHIENSCVFIVAAAQRDAAELEKKLTEEQIEYSFLYRK
jgi:uncharacterized YigZ family protein